MTRSCALVCFWGWRDMILFVVIRAQTHIKHSSMFVVGVKHDEVELVAARSWYRQGGYCNLRAQELRQMDLSIT